MQEDLQEGNTHIFLCICIFTRETRLVRELMWQRNLLTKKWQKFAVLTGQQQILTQGISGDSRSSERVGELPFTGREERSPRMCWQQQWQCSVLHLIIHLME